jgi:hypothetical protein
MFNFKILIYFFMYFRILVEHNMVKMVDVLRMTNRYDLTLEFHKNFINNK